MAYKGKKVVWKSPAMAQRQLWEPVAVSTEFPKDAVQKQKLLEHLAPGNLFVAIQLYRLVSHDSSTIKPKIDYVSTAGWGNDECIKVNDVLVYVGTMRMSERPSFSAVGRVVNNMRYVFMCPSGKLVIITDLHCIKPA